MRHREWLDTYYEMRELWLDRRDAACNGWATEEAEYAQRHPRPTLKAHMINR